MPSLIRPPLRLTRTRSTPAPFNQKGPSMAAVAQASRTGLTAPPRTLVAACFLSNFDRFPIGPVLIAVAAGLHVRLSATAAVASGYAIAYGLSQPMWGMLSDRFGRLPILR